MNFYSEIELDSRFKDKHVKSVSDKAVSILGNVGVSQSVLAFYCTLC